MFGICEELFPIFLHKKFAKFFLSAVDKMCGVLFLVPYKFLAKNGNFLHFLSTKIRKSVFRKMDIKFSHQKLIFIGSLHML